MTTEPKAFDTGPASHLDDPQTVRLPADFLPWQPGDIVLDANRDLYVRVRDDDSGNGEWPWCAGFYAAPLAGEYAGEGGTANEMLQRPLTLLVRDGKPIGGMRIDDQAETAA